MESQRNIMLLGLLLVSTLIWSQWHTDKQEAQVVQTGQSEVPQFDGDVPTTQPIITETKRQNNALIHVVTDTLDLHINPVGGDLVGADLRQFPKELGGSETFTLLEDKQSFTYVAQSGLVGPNGIDKVGNRPTYQFQASEYQMQPESNQLVVTLSTKQGALKYTKEFIFTRGHYDIEVRYTVDNLSQANATVQMYGQLKQSIQESQSSFLMPTYRGAAYSTEGERFTKYSFEDMKDSALSRQTHGGWISMIQHYFVSAWVPSGAGVNKFYSSVKNQDTALIGFLSPAATIAPQTSTVLSSKLFIGPKDQAALSALAEHLNLVVDYGFLWWLATPIHTLLLFFQSLVVNWGLAIILVTLTVRLLLYPLTKAQYVSMAKMRNLQPKLQSLKDRYGEDRQKMGQAMMELYRKEKVNPMGGCLPLLLQMPIFIALYWVLMESVELRHAPFMLWVDDLSVQDPYYVLPVLMGLSMWMMQKLQPQAANLDPMQQKMMQYMPVMFTVFFLWFPAGLVLYWLVGNIAAIGQQLFIYKSLEKRGLK